MEDKVAQGFVVKMSIEKSLIEGLAFRGPFHKQTSRNLAQHTTHLGAFGCHDVLPRTAVADYAECRAMLFPIFSPLVALTHLPEYLVK